jgi:hypothetical protein
MIKKILFSLILLIALVGCSSKQWYKGNTHVHTLLCGHADSSPEAVTAWYHERGYNFLCLSEHNQFIDPATVTMPADLRDDFILIPSEEVTGGNKAHSTALNIDGVVDPRLVQPSGASKTQVIQAHVHGAEQQHGHLILNHPNFHYSNTAEDIRPVEGLHLFELHNGHPSVNNFGDDEHDSVEEIWDDLLTDGMLIYGVSSDDAHHFQKLGPEHSNPGRGWVMVQADSLTPDAISEAMYRGDFYATSGVMLRKASVDGRRISVAVDEGATERELSSSFVVGHITPEGSVGISIQFIGPEGRVLESVGGAKASYSVSDEYSYVRAKVVYTRKGDNGYENFYAWMQPVFTDGRMHFVK